MAPQPYYGRLYMTYHDGDEELVVLDADHVLDVLSGNGPGVVDEAITEGLDWFRKNLRP